MKLIPLIILTMSTAINVDSNDHYNFPPQFRRPESGVSLDSSHYLPPDSQTSIPYLPMRNHNNLPYPYLPAATKAPLMFPSPFPMILSSTLVPIDDDDEENETEIRASPPPSFQRNNNRTESNRSQNVQAQNRELRPIPKYQPIDRIDMKNSVGFGPYHNPVQTATSRSFIITAEDPRSNIDQVKAGATAGPQYLQAPGLQHVFVSSTTEPAVPIIRLSNEMDLDGSFSYEALGADQTHYVQHSHMENQGTDKEEQVVEGSYSYVGDNGQTYTVHYIADSNGFRASGDHLPVAPPIPEIIQRAVQYNLAEESKKPPHLKSWQNNENELSESERIQYYANAPPRSLFTGKTPEAFSFSFGQGSQNNHNNIISAASTQSPNIEFTPEQVKNAGVAIAPQITFAATQGARAPSANPQQTMSRMPQLVNYEPGLKESQQDSDKALWRWQYGMNANLQQQVPEKNLISRSSGEGDDVMINFSDMTPDQYTKMIKSQLEPNSRMSQSSQTSQMSNNMQNYYQKQSQNEQHQVAYTTQKPIISTEPYYYPSTTVKQNTDKQSQYYPNEYNFSNADKYNTKPQSESNNNVFQNSPKTSNNINKSSEKDSVMLQIQNSPTTQKSIVSTKINYYPPQTENWYKSLNIDHQNQYYRNQNDYNFKPNESEKSDNLLNARSKLVTHKKFTPSSQTVTQSYNYQDTKYNENNFYESEKIRSSTLQPHQSNHDVNIKYYSREKSALNGIPTQNEQAISTTEAWNNYQFTDFVSKEPENKFKSSQNQNEQQFFTNYQKEETTTEMNKEDFLRDNIFLRSLFKTKNNEQNENNKNKEDSKPLALPFKSEPKPVENISKNQQKVDKLPKFISIMSKPHNELQSSIKKPMNMADILNFISTKNHFESNKLRPKNNLDFNYDQRTDARFIPVQHDRDQDNEEDMTHDATEFRSTYYEPEELRGIIKNYKVLQRNNSVLNTVQDTELNRDLSPPPLKASNLPPLGRAGPSMKTYLPPIYV